MPESAELVNDFPSQNGFGDFLTADHHRVLASLSRPRTVDDLVTWLAKHEPQTTSGRARTTDGLAGLLEELAEHGLVKNIGDAADATDPADAAQLVVNLAADDADVPNMPEEEVEGYVTRAAERDDSYPFPYVVDGEGAAQLQDTGDLWYWTELGKAKLQAPAVYRRPNAETGEMELVPDTRALTGAELRAAQKFDREWHKRNAAVTRENLKRAAEAARKHAHDLDQQLRDLDDEE